MKIKLLLFSIISLLLSAGSGKLNAAAFAGGGSGGGTFGSGGGGGFGGTGGSNGEDLSLKILQPEAFQEQAAKQVTWLGLAVDEASEALSSQLQLEPGVGLVVTYVTPDSPAAKAGLQKNDVLVKFDDQLLVHPAQLRKLVQVRKEGDVVKLAYCRAGKQVSVSVTLAQTSERGGWPINEKNWKDALQNYEGYVGAFREKYGDTLRGEMKNLQRSLGELHLEQDQVRKEALRGMEQAKKAAKDALRYATNDFKKFGPSARTLEGLARGWVGINKDATVTINSSGNAVRTVVKADDNGTYVIVANPRKHLTVHDSSGKLLFDGEIETPEEQAKVPRDIWEKVEPMISKMKAEG